MVILGLGSNLGDRLQHLRQALTLLKKTPNFSVKKVSPVYISDALLPENAEESWNIPYLNLALRCETTLTPHELLTHTKNIELQFGRKTEKRWSPRPIDIDILAWDNEILYDEKLHIPHEQLHLRPFALWPLADVAPEWIYPLQNTCQGKTAAEIAALWGSRFSGEAPLHTRQIPHRIDTPQLVGILNLTPDSFSKDGIYCNEHHALEHAKLCIASGAEVIDIGAEATNPNAKPVDKKEEWQRLLPTLKFILENRKHFLLPPKISVDTRHVAIAKQCLDLGIDWINDVSGLDDPAMRELIAATNCDLILMHHRGIPVDIHHMLPPHENPVTQVYNWAEKRLALLEKQGIAKQRIIFDVGIGFGKNPEHSLALIQNIATFKSLGTRLLVGHSRKRFLSLFTDKSFVERDTETQAISSFLATQAVDFLRLHNIELCARTFKVEKTI